MLHLQDCPPLIHPTHTQHAQALRTDVCRTPTAGHGAGAARRPVAQQPAPAHQRSDPPSPPHNTVVVRRGEGTGRSTAAHPAEAWCATPPLRPPVHAQGVAPATPSSTPAWGFLDEIPRFPIDRNSKISEIPKPKLDSESDPIFPLMCSDSDFTIGTA
jgi:hypothetical protein